MTTTYLKKPEGEPVFPQIAKLRRCLICGESFPSSWAGERVCRACKDTEGWAGGDSPFEPSD